MQIYIEFQILKLDLSNNQNNVFFIMINFLINIQQKGTHKNYSSKLSRHF